MQTIEGKVFSLEQAKAMRKVRQTKETYRRYLRSIKDDQLHYELDYLFREFSQDDSKQDFCIRGQLIQQELLNRAQGDVRQAIQRMSLVTEKMIEDQYPTRLT
jgi:hypothetical protein